MGPQNQRRPREFMWKDEKIFRELIPISRSVLWLPVGDSRYVVASLTGRASRQLFVSQDVLAQLDAIGATAQSRPTLGLLLGALYRCPATHEEYMIVRALAERAWSLGTPGRVPEVLREAVAAQRERSTNRVLGYYFPGDTRGHLSADATAAHGFLEDHEWRIALSLGNGPDGVWGTFFRYDAANGGAYAIPFRELMPSGTPLDSSPKPTAIAWPTYLTGDATIPLKRKVAPLPVATEVRRVTAVPDGPSAVPSPPDRGRRHWARAPRGAPGEVPGLDARSKPAAAPVELTANMSRRSVPSADQGIALTPVRRADLAPESYEGVPGDSGSSVDEPAIPVIESARQDGFFVAAKFVATGGSAAHETLWVLHDPYSGLLLIVVTTSSEVVDATLHYNLRVDDLNTLEAAFSEHRDFDARAIYRCESCSANLSARCRQLRDTEALLREWKVTPAIYLVTPAEWESLAGDDPIAGARAIQTLNRQRVEMLPEAIVARYGLIAR